MTILVAFLSFMAGVAVTWAAARNRIRDAEARAELRGLTTRHIIESSAGMVP